MDPKEILKTHKNWLTPTENEEINSKDLIYYLNTTFKQKTEYTNDDRLVLNHDDQIDYRYQVLNELGKGTFSNVYKCIDHKYDHSIAMKVIRHNLRYKNQSLIEKEIYHIFHASGKKNVNILNLLKCFTYRDNLFIAYELFGIDLYYYYKKYDTRNDVRNFGRQIANGLSFIHSLDIVHLDLKPENILIYKYHLKIIDFGSSTLLDKNEKKIMNYAQSRYYRAPEMVFKTPFGVKTDIWSFGCILYELYTGKPLFPARRNYDLIIYYFYVLGYPDPKFSWVYENEKLMNLKKKDLITYKTKDNKKLIPGSFDWILMNDDIELRDFIWNKCLCFDLNNRISANEILIDPIFLTHKTEL